MNPTSLPSDHDLPSWLVEERRWVQGSLFTAPSVGFTLYQEDLGSSAESVLVPRQLPPEPGDRFVVVSQTCDIKDRIDREPCIEALRCTIEPDQVWRSNIAHSARWFEVDRTAGLVAHAMYRVQIDKRALVNLEAEPWPDTPERLRRFVEWLGRRFDRPAIPDEIVEHFQRKVEATLRKVRKQPVGRAFTRAVRQVRIDLPEDENPPFDIEMVLLLKKLELSEEEATALDAVREGIRKELDANWIRLGKDRQVTAEEMSLAEYEKSRPLFLESLTYRGDEVIGAEPPARA